VFHCYTAASDNVGGGGSVVRGDVRENGGTDPAILNLGTSNMRRT
jgi:hypothetical protein